MNSEKIAILVDSGSDLPKQYLEKPNVFVAPLLVCYKDNQFYDGIDITSEDVCDRFSEEIPTTSMPTGQFIEAEIQSIKSAGFKKVIVATISSNLSGTFNTMRVVTERHTDLDFRLFDTKNISVGSGFTAMLAADLIDEGLDFETICVKLQENTKNSKVFFCVSTLEYLRKGGRIGLVSSMLGSLLDLKPIISCNDDGVYYTASKTRGRRQSIEKAVSMAIEFAGKFKHCNIAILNTKAADESKAVIKQLKSGLKNCKKLLEGGISPSLVVHTGPGLIGIAIQGIN